MNFMAASLVLYSCIYYWNTTTFICNITWLFLSLYGVKRCLKYKDDSVKEIKSFFNKKVDTQ